MSRASDAYAERRRAASMAIYDTLPREVRDAYKNARTNLIVLRVRKAFLVRQADTLALKRKAP